MAQHRSAICPEPRCHCRVVDAPNQQEYRHRVDRSSPRQILGMLAAMLVTINVWVNSCIHRIRSIGADSSGAIFSVHTSLRSPSKRRIRSGPWRMCKYPCQLDVKARPASYRTLMYNTPRAHVNRRTKCLRVAAEISVQLTHVLGDDAIAL